MHSPVRQEQFESLFDNLFVHGTLIMLPARKPESTQAFQYVISLVHATDSALHPPRFLFCPFGVVRVVRC